MRRSVFLVLVTAAAAACGDPVAPDRGVAPSNRVSASGEGEEASAIAHLDLRQERASLIAAADALSDAIQAQGIAAALAAAFAPDVQFLSPRVPILQGASATLTFLTTHPTAPTAMRWAVVRADVSSDGTHGYTWTQGFFTIDLGTGAAERAGVFLIYWRRDVAGTWRVAAMVFNLRDPQAPTTLPAEFATPTSKHRRYFPQTEIPPELAAVMAADAAFSAMSVSDGTGLAFTFFAAPDAIAIGNGAFVLGPEAIGAAFTLGPNDLVFWTPIYGDVAASGDLGFTVGNATFNLEPDIIFFTKYLTVWQKQNSGEWKFVADLGSSRPGS